MPPLLRRRRQLYRIHIPIISRCFPNLVISVPRIISFQALFTLLASSALYLLGPILIFVTFGLLFSLSWTFWNILIPLKFQSYTSTPSVLSQLFVGCILINIVFNYILCVRTKNHGTEEYEKVVRELARATGFEYPNTKEEMEIWFCNWRERILERSKQKRLQKRYNLMSKYGMDEEKVSLLPTDGDGNANEAGVGSLDKNQNQNSIEMMTTNQNQNETLKNRKKEATQQPSSPPTQPMGRSWMWLGPNEWSYCERSRLPKPPRSHYDHVTKGLVLNMDHYCPWMFNVVGYFNYRYFVNFLVFTSTGMIYGAIIAFAPFMMIDSPAYREQISLSRQIHQQNESVKFSRFHHVEHLIPNVPTPNEVSAVAFAFMICFAVGLSVLILLGFHIYLILTAQTTIEFHGNRLKKSQSEMRNQVFCNPYDMGWRRNLEQVWGDWGGSWIWFSMVFRPSLRKNEFLPIPFKGDAGLRSRWDGSFDDSLDEDFMYGLV